ncbi:hypothetical protein CC2G_004713 [Coprinopsis cinerea AmutBmut pab1-1]|nr:hypothetical protein CC2G_004713 [Coprinopsis cinerea AmutBmut pab1-1]
MGKLIEGDLRVRGSEFRGSGVTFGVEGGGRGPDSEHPGSRQRQSREFKSSYITGTGRECRMYCMYVRGWERASTLHKPIVVIVFVIHGRLASTLYACVVAIGLEWRSSFPGYT